MARRFLVALTFVALAACSRGSSPEATPASGEEQPKRLRVVTSFAIESLDPVEEGFWFPEFGSAETPMRVGEKGPEPWVLESLDRTSDTTWRLRLRPGVTFQNGAPLDGAALAATMARQLEKSSSAQAVLGGAKVERAGDLEVTLTTAAPDATVPHTLADESVFPVYDTRAVEAVGDDAAKLADAGFYTGPYAVKSLDDRELVLDRYDGYWAGKPPLPGVTVGFVPDAQARILAVRNGEADIAVYVPTEAKRTLEGRTDAFYVTAEHGKETVTMPLNVARPPFDDVAVRRALSLGVDYRSIAEEVLDGAYDVATGMYPPVYPYAVANQRTDPAAAAAALDAAGWKPGAGGVRAKSGRSLAVVLLTYPQQPDLQPIAVAIQSQLKPLGFDVEIRPVEDITAAQEDPGAWNAALVFNGTADFTGAPEPYLRRYLVTGGSDNTSGVSDPTLDKLAGQVASTFDPAVRRGLLAQIQRIVVEDQAYLVVASLKRFPAVVSPAYRGYRPSSSLNHVTFGTRPTS